MTDLLSDLRAMADAPGHASAVCARAVVEIERLQDALWAAEKADEQKNKCGECLPEQAPEACQWCFPSADDARVKRWAALGINQPDARAALTEKQGGAA